MFFMFFNFIGRKLNSSNIYRERKQWLYFQNDEDYTRNFAKPQG